MNTPERLPTRPLARPLSPYLQYVNARTLHTMGFSILHRITGVALSIGLLLLTYWLIAAASGVESYERARAFFANIVVQILLIGWLFSFCYHFCNGLRHLVWDTGRGFALATARKSGYSAFIAAALATVLISVVFWTRFHGGSL